MNFHWYIADPQALGEAAAFLPEQTTAVRGKIVELDLPIAVWFGLDGPKGGKRGRRKPSDQTTVGSWGIAIDVHENPDKVGPPRELDSCLEHVAARPDRFALLWGAQDALNDSTRRARAAPSPGSHGV